MVGWEGMICLAMVHSTDRSPHHVVTQIEGHAWRIAATPFRAALAESASLLAAMLRAAQAVYVQTTYTAL